MKILCGTILSAVVMCGLALEAVGKLRVETIPGTPESDAVQFYTNDVGFVEINYDEDKAGVLGRDYTIPDPLVFSDGRRVANASDWSARRRGMKGHGNKLRFLGIMLEMVKRYA